jgi:hypothetical protein
MPRGEMMSTIAQMTRDELREMIEIIIEQKLTELLFDLDKGLELRSEVQERLLQQEVAVAGGERGQSLDDVIQKLGLN